MALPPIQFVFGCILLCPLLIWNSITYLSKDYYCYVRFTNTRGILWLAIGIYGIPISLLSLIYLKITKFLKKQSKNQTTLINQHQQRDILVFRRIIITVGLLVILGISPIVFLIMAHITGEEYFLAFRIIWPFISLTMIGSSFSLTSLTPQLKTIFLSKFQHIRVCSMNNTVTNSNSIQ